MGIVHEYMTCGASNPPFLCSLHVSLYPTRFDSTHPLAPSPTTDDLWSLDLNKLDGWRCVKENTVGEEAFRELSDEEWETDSDDSQ